MVCSFSSALLAALLSLMRVASTRLHRLRVNVIKSPSSSTDRWESPRRTLLDVRQCEATIQQNTKTHTDTRTIGPSDRYIQIRRPRRRRSIRAHECAHIKRSFTRTDAASFTRAGFSFHASRRAIVRRCDSCSVDVPGERGLLHFIALVDVRLGENALQTVGRHLQQAVADFADSVGQHHCCDWVWFHSADWYTQLLWVVGFTGGWAIRFTGTINHSHKHFSNGAKSSFGGFFTDGCWKVCDFIHCGRMRTEFDPKFRLLFCELTERR